jgi:hypothetical protein
MNNEFEIIYLSSEGVSENVDATKIKRMLKVNSPLEDFIRRYIKMSKAWKKCLKSFPDITKIVFAKKEFCVDCTFLLCAHYSQDRKSLIIKVDLSRIEVELETDACGYPIITKEWVKDHADELEWDLNGALNLELLNMNMPGYTEP